MSKDHPSIPVVRSTSLVSSDDAKPKTTEKVLSAMVAGDSEAAGTDDDEPADISPPAVDESSQDDDIDDVESAILFVHQPKCLQCGHLVSFAEKKYKNCHFTAGNENCPAQATKIEIMLDTSKIVMNFIRTEEAQDYEKLSRLYAALAKREPWAQRQIQDAIREAREKRSK